MWFLNKPAKFKLISFQAFAPKITHYQIFSDKNSTLVIQKQKTNPELPMFYYQRVWVY